MRVTRRFTPTGAALPWPGANPAFPDGVGARHARRNPYTTMRDSTLDSDQ